MGLCLDIEKQVLLIYVYNRSKWIELNLCLELGNASRAAAC